MKDKTEDFDEFGPAPEDLTEEDKKRIAEIRKNSELTAQKRQAELMKKGVEKDRLDQEKLNRFAGGFGQRISPINQDLFEEIKKRNNSQELKQFFFENGKPKNWLERSYDTTKIDATKKTMLIFPGTASVTPQDANFYAKFVENLVGTAQDDGFDLFSFYYDRFEENKRDGKFSDQRLEQVFESFVKPLLKDENNKFFEQKQIEKNLSNLRFFAHCYGSCEVDHLLEKTAMVLQTQFSQEDAKKMLSKVFVTHYAPYSHAHKFGTHVQFRSFQDQNVNILEHEQKEMKDFKGFAKIFWHPNENALDITSHTFADFGKTKNEHLTSLLLKQNGVIDRMMLAKTPLEKERLVCAKKINPNGQAPRPAGYSRQQAISDMLATSIAYGLLHDTPNLKDLEMIFDVTIKKEEQIVFEKEFQKKGGGDGKKQPQILEQDTATPKTPKQFFEGFSRKRN